MIRVAALLFALCVPSMVRAQPEASSSQAPAGDPLEEAEAAYLDVDFDRTLASATQALERGGNNQRRLIRIYQLIGIAAAALDQEDRSREAYVRMLALDPDATVDRNLAPRLRSTFLEARGFWTARNDRFSMEASFSRTRGGVRVDLIDPASLVHELVVVARVAGQRETLEARRPAAPSVLIPIEGSDEARGVEYAVAAVDEHGNLLLESGTPDDPRVFGTMEIAATPPTQPRGDDSTIFESPIFWIVAGVVVAGGVVGGIFLLSDTTVEGRTDVEIGLR